MDAVNIENWVAHYRRLKWRWAGQLVRDSHGKWSQKVLLWLPECEVGAQRCQGRPRMRWDDCLAEHVAHTCVKKDDWKAVARDAETWSAMEDAFAQKLDARTGC